LGLFFSQTFLSFFGRLGAGLILGGLFLLSLILWVDFSPFLAKQKIKKQLSVKKKPSPLEKLKKEKTKKFAETSVSSTSLPPLSLLNPVPSQRKTVDEVKMAGRKLCQTLGDFRVEVEIDEVKEGPAVNRFEVRLAPGVKVSKLMSLSSDLALSLAVPNVRIEVPVSGKSLVGVEVPKKKINFVYLRELLEGEKFRESKAKLLFPLGKDIAGAPVWVNLESLPHLLIGGATGSGKSVCINSLIVSILYRDLSEEVKFLLIDPKTVELVDYSGIPHLLFPPITEIKQANSALEWVVQEVKRRYQQFSQAGVRDIASFNSKMKSENEPIIPYLVVIIDELADLMMLAGTGLEKTICRIAQLARATGIHLVVATQRPSVDVITGLIKANFPSRISFAVASQVDSRTILDATGAERLVGNGDMLYSPVEASQPFRIQGSFISPSEVKRVVDFIREQGKPTYLDEIVKGVEEEKDQGEIPSHDELFPEAKELVMRRGKASTSLLQRRLSIGYNRAARIMDQLEKARIVGPSRGSKPREVLRRES
jgi:S-DNA-T family DNA segregation ATPase FtsK/SpoIIIE